jgi:hypothetical protein
MLFFISNLCRNAQFSVLYEDGNGMEKIAILMELGGTNLRQYASELMSNADINESKFLWIVKQMLLGLNEVHSAGQYTYKCI